jgi:exodeoxyribonuclease V alpha subunit
MKVYAGPPAAARAYLEADRGRADDYYLAEGTGLARRFVARDGRVQELAALTGKTYETWVAGRDPDTGEPRGRLRTDDRAVRFVEVVVNGPKSWSLAAALHSDVAAAYDAAQDRAATQIIGWLGEHATTRVGPRGGQLQVPVEVLEAVTVRHHTSRAGDPHRHLHLQVNARVLAAGRWRGLHTVGVRDFLAAVNGIGHAAVASDPRFRAALASHGYTLSATGEILQLAGYIGPFSARAAQIGRHRDRYEREWTAANPGQIPGPALRRVWDARAWAEGRPDKVVPQPGADLTARWVAELVALGYRDPGRPVDLTPTPVGGLDRNGAVARVLARLAAGRSAWNAADVRGEVEQLIAAAGIVVDAAVRGELAEDLTARTMARCVPLLDQQSVPEHIRAWTSQPVLDVEDDLTARFAARSAPSPADQRREPEPEPALQLAALARLDPGQGTAAALLAGDRPLIVIEGAAGAGKTTLLTAARDLLAAQGRRLTVVTPTLKAAKVAAAEIGTATGSGAWLAYQHGWRWDDDSVWTRLTSGRTDPVTGAPHAGPEAGARLAPGDLLVVDEAGMLDQDTARALLTIADEHHVRVALVGDRHQLAAVGRGGVLDLAAGQVDPAAHLTLDAVHRFVRTDQTAPDVEYAELTLAMRTGANPADVFDALVARGQVCIHADPAGLQETLAGIAAAHYAQEAAGAGLAVVVDTREQAADLNDAIRERLVAGGRVDDTRVVITRSGQRIGVGDRIATRRNDRYLDVANRDTWTVTAADRGGRLTVTPTIGDVTPAGVIPSTGERVLPADYVTAHVELAYASTAHGVQGATVATAHVVVGEHTGAASAYVGMTRGRTANTAHLIAVDLVEARQQWIAVFGRDRADLGPGHAAQLAAAEAAHYAAPRPLQEVLAELHEMWTTEQRCLTRLALLQPMRERLAEVVTIHTGQADQMAALETRCRASAVAANRATQQVEVSGRAVTAHAERIREDLLGRWESERNPARAAARVVLDGPGRLRLRRAAVTHAGGQLADWADRWRPHLPQLPGDPGRLAQYADRSDDRPALATAFGAAARRAAEHAHPEHAVLRAAADAARHEHEQARHALAEAERRRSDELGWFGALGRTPDPAGRLADLDRDIAADQHGLATARARIDQLKAEPTLAAQAADRLAAEHDAWRSARDADRHLVRSSSRRPVASAVDIGGPQLRQHHGLSAGSRGVGPSLGR